MILEGHVGLPEPVDAVRTPRRPSAGALGPKGMSLESQEHTNITRRAFGLAIGLSPVVLLAASITVGLTITQRPILGGVGFMIGASVIAFLNFYLSFIRPRIYLAR